MSAGYDVVHFANGPGRVHPRKACAYRIDAGDGYCPIHAPSDHKMVEWPMVLRQSGLIERVCEHRVGHPDPDSAQYLYDTTGQEYWLHGCEGCCADWDTCPACGAHKAPCVEGCPA